MLNRIILMGRICNDLELKQTPNGINVVSFAIAVDRNYSSGGQKQTDFPNIVAWRNTAEYICKYFSKGRMIAVEGSLQTRKYEDKNGNQRTAYDVVIDQAYFADSKPDNSANTSKPKQPDINAQNTDFSEFEELETDEADLPF